MDFIVTPEEFEEAMREAVKNPRGATKESVEEVIRKYREAYENEPIKINLEVLHRFII